MHRARTHAMPSDAPRPTAGNTFDLRKDGFYGGAAETLSRSSSRFSNATLPTPPTVSLRAQESPRTRQKTRYNPHGRDIDDNHKLFRLACAASAGSQKPARAAAILATLGNEGLPP